MSRDFRGELLQRLLQTQRDTYAWLGAVRYVVYSSDVPKPEEHEDDRDSGRKRVSSDIQTSSDSWYEALNTQLMGAFRCAEGALSNEWAKQRDPRHTGPDAEENFAHSFESNIAAIARTVLETEKKIDGGRINESKQMRDSIGWVKADLKALISLYEEHLHELTMSVSNDDLLGLRAQIMDGRTRS